jgi:catechol 2,3-dioxygenase-like lactoylglutathione lyase family enzyme
MTVQRIVPNIAVADPGLARAFYETLLGLKIVMDHGWIVTFACGGIGSAPAQRCDGGRLGHTRSRRFN